ncbi:MAG: hypothetical protein ABEJ57_07990 [Halobacteriaceae archaeon]
MAAITDFLDHVRHPRIAIVLAAGLLLAAVAAVLTFASVGPPAIAFRIGVLGYLLVLFGGAGYIALAVAAWAEDR